MPPTAMVKVNGASRGRTPAKLELAVGIHQVVLTSGENTGTFSVNVTDGGQNKWCYSFAESRPIAGNCPR